MFISTAGETATWHARVSICMCVFVFSVILPCEWLKKTLSVLSLYTFWQPLEKITLCKNTDFLLKIFIYIFGWKAEQDRRIHTYTHREKRETERERDFSIHSFSPQMTTSAMFWPGENLVLGPPSGAPHQWQGSQHFRQLSIAFPGILQGNDIANTQQIL